MFWVFLEIRGVPFDSANNCFSAGVSLGRSVPIEALLVQLCWQDGAACASETVLFLSYLQAEVWCCSCLNGTTLKELIVGNTVLLKMRDVHLRHKLRGPFHTWTNAQTDKYIIFLMLLFDQPEYRFHFWSNWQCEEPHCFVCLLVGLFPFLFPYLGCISHLVRKLNLKALHVEWWCSGVCISHLWVLEHWSSWKLDS